MSPKSVWSCLAVWCLVTLCQAGSFDIPAAQDTLPKKSYVLSTVRVVAESDAEAIGAVHLVNFPEAKAASALNLYEGLQGISGVTDTSGTKDESSLRIRGFRKNEVKLLIDGRPLNPGYFGNVDLHQLAPADIQEIRVIKGPGSAIYGSGTMGGVVNIITADPDNSSLFRLSLLAKRNNSNRIALTSAHRIGSLGYWIYAAREHNDGLVLPRSFVSTPFENGGVRDHSRKTQYDLQTRLDYRLGQFSELGFSAGVTYVPEKLLPSSVHELDYRLYKDWQRHWLTLAYESTLSGALKLSSHLYYDGGGDTYQQFNDAAHQHMNMDSVMRNRTLGFNPRLEWVPDDKNTLSFGLRAETLYSTRKDTGSYLVWTPHWLNLYNAFSQWEYRWSDALTATAGLGLSSHQSDLRNTLSLYPEPSMGIFYDWSGSNRTSLSLGKNTSFPTMRQLFSADRGNPDLLPQHALKAELEHQTRFYVGKLLLSNSITLFYNDMRDLIDVSGGIYQNIYRVRSEGLEYSLLCDPLPWWEAELGYTLLFWHSEDSYRLTETPRNKIDLSQSFRLPLGITLRHTCSYTDIRQSQDSSEDYHTLRSYWLNDLTLSRKFGRQSVSLGLENIFDTLYETEYGYPGAGLNFFLGISAQI